MRLTHIVIGFGVLAVVLVIVHMIKVVRFYRRIDQLARRELKQCDQEDCEPEYYL